ncbi:MauE/DoxX family redox-associated membrane protein [Geopsychrobacter electrodiphilus]|uniref:MauE/DoxX family redox-associated membrane protein n=1 Tax=Geopsychrobacter electrodiphilus TaxID=225196 RepID=UPI000360AA9F|nr:MauE/DoxX family redox-associated membrane protein [Geopsychrobacter electrodiphilus]
MKLWLYHLCRLLLAGVFIYAGFLKGLDPVAFAGQVAAYKILPYAFNYFVAATLPFVEVLCGILLLLNQRVRPALLVLFGLNGVFMLALSSLLARGLEIDCGCFHPGGEAGAGTSPLMALVRDAGLMLVILTTWVLRQRQAQESPDE